jgi:hypothetical protein
MKTTLLLSSAFLTLGAFAQNNNCATATQVCNDVSFSGNSSGPGTQQLNASNQGCLSIEHQSSWYYFQPVTSGTVALTIQTSADYDFAIWATGNCNALGAPVRCSYSATTGNTGLISSFQYSGPCFTCGFFCCVQNVTDASEGAGGDKWVMPLNVVAGQTYIMLIDNFTANSTPFTLDWTFSGGASLNCAPVILPLELVEWMANYDRAKNANQLYWQTATERYNDHFTVEHSVDAINWEVINEQPGQENATVPTKYTYDDIQFVPGKTNYYRLSQTDYDGTTELFDVIAVDNEKNMRKVVKVYNTMGQEIPMDSPGLVILQYDDGTTSRIMR